MQRDSLGRRRDPAQNRGLRPLHPKLEGGHRSRSVRVAMSERAWAALERAVKLSRAATRPCAIGELLEEALGTSPGADWQEWQIRKEKQLLEQRAS
jgi:hypothetical protein